MRASSNEISQPSRREPATAVFTRRVKPGHELRYEALAREMIEASEAFPGQFGATMLHETGSPNYTLLYSFTDQPALRAWLDSTQRGQLLTRADQIATAHLRLPPLTGLERWFTLPASSHHQTTTALEDVARLATRDLPLRRRVSGPAGSLHQDLATAPAIGDPSASFADADDVCSDARRYTHRSALALTRQVAPPKHAQGLLKGRLWLARSRTLCSARRIQQAPERLGLSRLHLMTDEPKRGDPSRLAAI